jgi:hypothetical protein
MLLGPAIWRIAQQKLVTLSPPLKRSPTSSAMREFAQLPMAAKSSFQVFE